MTTSFPFFVIKSNIEPISKVCVTVPSIWMLSISGKKLIEIYAGTMEISTFKKNFKFGFNLSSISWSK